MEVKLIVASGNVKGRTIPLPSTVVTIGRGRQCHLRPRCRMVSKLHCAIARWAGKVVVRDLKSCNGTFINGKRVHGEVQVHDGDVLRIGTLEFTFHIQMTPEEMLPVQVVHPSDVHWLMNSKDSSDSSVTKPPDTCSDQDAASLFPTANPTNPGPPASGPELCAGEYLRDYFRKHE